MDLISKPRSKSLVWMYFGLKADEKGQPLRTDEAICRLCRKIVLAKGGNTTNLRSHLKRRHRADFIEQSLSSPLGTGFDTGFEPNPEELIEELQSLSAQSASNHYVPDTVLPSGEPWLQGGPSRAVLSLPSCLGLSDSGMQLSETSVTDMKVVAKCHLHVGVMFGPFVGEMCKGHVPDNLKCAWAIRDEAAFIYVDGSDANKSNWMRFVTYTSSEVEHNLTVFQFYRRIYYKVSQPISEGAELKVWVGRDYASLLGLGIGENIKCEVGDKETFLRPLQDIQLVTLPEPSSSSLWSDQSQSQSPMPIISEVTSINPDVTSDTGSALPSSSQGSFPSPYGHPYEKYDFLPGTERLLNNPNVLNTSDNSVWYFFGFEPDHTGRPLDRNTVVCKLCGDRLSCAGSIAELQSHLMTKHHIRPRESSISKERQTGLRSLPPVPVSPVSVMDSILDFLIMDLQPPAVVQGAGFKQLIHSLTSFTRDLPSQLLLENQLKELHIKGRRTMAHMLRRKADVSDYMAPLELGQNRNVPHLVNFSVDVWFHTWQGTTEMYLTLWVHYIDASFDCHNRALATQKLTKSGLNLKAVESQVKAMAEEWGISQPNLVLLGGEGWNEIRVVPMSIKNGGEASGCNTHPNSTTFLEREDSASPEEPPDMEQSLSSEELPSIPCFFSAVQSCMEEVMSHHVISKTLSHFQNILSAIFVQSAQSIGVKQEYAEKLFGAMTKEEQVEVKLWGHSRPSWNKLYLLLSTLIKHKSLVRDITKELNEDTGFESTSSGSCSLRAEWKVVEDLCLVLKPLDVACQTVAKEDFPRLSLVKPILTGLLSRHLVTRPGDSSILKEVKMMMKHNLTSWYDNPVVNKVLCVACAVDPQFHALRFMEEKEQTDTFEWLKNEAVRIAKDGKPSKQGRKPQKIKRSPSSSSPDESLRRSKRLKDCEPINFRDLDGSEGEASDDDDSNDTEWVEPPPDDGLSGMEFLLGDLYSSTSKGKQSSVEESVDMEMSVFKADKGASLGVEPLQWWKTKAGQLPLLATVAQAYLAAPAVAGIATQDFLQEGAGCSRGKRSNIPPENLDAILFLHHNRIHKTKPKQC